MVGKCHLDFFKSLNYGPPNFWYHIRCNILIFSPTLSPLNVDLLRAHFLDTFCPSQPLRSSSTFPSSSNSPPSPSSQRKSKLTIHQIAVLHYKPYNKGGRKEIGKLWEFFPYWKEVLTSKEGTLWYQQANFNVKISSKRGNFYFHGSIPMKGIN